MQRRFREASADPAGEYWALGRTEEDLPSELRDEPELHAALLARYSESSLERAFLRCTHGG